MARIILADDDDLLAEVVQSVLTGAGHIVGAVQDGEAAVEAICRRLPDLAILDISMPKLAGPEVVRQIRASQAAYDTPILMLTARRNKADQDIAMRSGADDYLTKPFDPDQLIARVDRLLMERKRVF